LHRSICASRGAVAAAYRRRNHGHHADAHGLAGRHLGAERVVVRGRHVRSVAAPDPLLDPSALRSGWGRRRRPAGNGTNKKVSITTIGVLGILALLAAIVARVPIGVALALTGFLGYAAADGWSKALRMLGSVPYDLASAYSLSVVPLFLLMGAVASRGIMAQELFDAANAIFSGFRGALANAPTGACALFGGICGSSIADAATFSKVAIPEMRRHGYDASFAGGTVASAGTLAILIPPSVLTALYAIVAEQSL